MATRRLLAVAVPVLTLSLISLIPSAAAYAAKKTKQESHHHEVVPTPISIQDGMVIQMGPCSEPGCEHKCCQRRDRKCHHHCAAALCQPSIEYRGCPAPCSVEKVVSVTNPKTCCTVDLVVQVPACGREKVDRHHDGDLELDYGKYEVKIAWRDSGRRLVVRYDD